MLYTTKGKHAKSDSNTGPGIQTSSFSHLAVSSKLSQSKSACACGGACPSCQAKVPVQAKLNLSGVGDKYEQEADRVADQIVNEKNVDRPILNLSGKVQRQPLIKPEEDEEETKPELIVQTKAAGTQQESDITSTAILTHLGGRGVILPDIVRSDFEQRMGYDFNHVRIHTDDHSASLAERLNARAFTVNHHVVFGHNQYQPDTRQGRHLLAHELTHVVQQTGAGKVAAQTIFPTEKRLQRKVNPAKCRATGLSQEYCDTAQNDFILAEKAVNKAKGVMYGGGSHSRKVERALKCYFHTSLSAHKLIIKNKLDRISGALKGYNKEINEGNILFAKGDPRGCTSRKGGPVIAYTHKANIDSKGNLISRPYINLCDNVYFGRTQDQRVRTVVHEFAHVMGIAPDNSRDEIRVDDDGFLLLKSSRLLKVADSYAHLVVALARDDWPNCSADNISAGVETGVLGSASSAHRAGWYATVYIDVTSKTPVLRFFYPYRRLGFTIMATPARQPKSNIQGIQADMTYLVELLAGARIKLRKSPLGLNWNISLGGGPLVVINGIPDDKGDIKRLSGGLKATVVSGFRFKRLEIKANLSYLYLPGVPGFTHTVQGGITVGGRFYWP